MFDGLIIKNCKADILNHTIFGHLFKSLKPLSNCEVVVINSLAAQCDLDLIESNSKYVGFTNFIKDYNSLKLLFTKPDKAHKTHTIVKRDIYKEFNRQIENKIVDDIKKDLIKLDKKIKLAKEKRSETPEMNNINNVHSHYHNNINNQTVRKSSSKENLKPKLRISSKLFYIITVFSL